MKRSAVFMALWVPFLTPLAGAAQVPESPNRQQIVHLLNRAAYGPRPGDVERVIQIGISAYLDRQLDPGSIDDSETEAAVNAYSILHYSRSDLAELETERRRLARQAAAFDSGESPSAEGARTELAAARERGRQLTQEVQQVALVRAISSERQLYEVMVDFWANHFNVFMAKEQLGILVPGYIEEVIRPRALGSFRDLLGATAHSPAMLAYLDNARSVTPGSETPRLAQARERIDRAAGRGLDVSAEQERMERALASMPRGLNENYARELLELHTVGVDGGYTQEDVIAVARIFTGWSYDRNAGFASQFNDWAHDRGRKTVMGHGFGPNGGSDEGELLLDILASHQATMRFIGSKLCARLVNDIVPPGCVDAVVEAWTASDGDIATVVRAILTSPEFWDETNFDAKIKTPLEFVASAVRALGGRSDSTTFLSRAVGRLGQPLYLFEAPTGYPEDADAWINSGALLNRMNSALQLAAGRLRGVELPPRSDATGTGDNAATIAAISDAILHGRVTENTLRVMQERTARMSDPQAVRNLVVGMAIGGPEFQRQ